MKKLLKSKALLLALVAVAVVSVTATAVVFASIPTADGIIGACYKNNTKVLMVADQPGICGSGETPIGWSQYGGPQAYAHVYYNTNTNALALDSNRSKNISLVADTASGACLITNFTPKSISATGDGSIIGFADQFGWSDPSAEFCTNAYPGSNIAFNHGTGSFYVTVFR
jgi:hypothetical protein